MFILENVGNFHLLNCLESFRIAFNFISQAVRSSDSSLIIFFNLATLQTGTVSHGVYFCIASGGQSIL